MDIFDIIGPIMIGPSSSHTAGAVRIGYLARKLLGEPVKEARIMMYGSFYATGRGHGTMEAVVAGLLGMKADDMDVPRSFEIAKERGMTYSFGEAKLKDGHPNSVQMFLTGEQGRTLEIVGQSLGGGRVNIAELNGIATNFSGEYPTLIVLNVDQPGHATEVTSMLAHKSVNIASMQIYRSGRGGDAVMVIECDQEIPLESIKWLEHIEGIKQVTYLCLV